jgi:predicted ester cyclase
MVVERYVKEVLNRHDLGALDELVADETLKQRVRLFLEAFPDLAVEPNLVVADGELVAVNLIGHGTHQGIFQGVPPTGRRWAATCSAFYRVEGGQIADAWVNWDVLGILDQLGQSADLRPAGGPPA